MGRAYLESAVCIVLSLFADVNADGQVCVTWDTDLAHSEGRPVYGIMFWNVENLFDVMDDPEKDDDEFLPDGLRRWNGWRFWKKINDIARVVHSFRDLCGSSPVLLGLAEVENRYVLDRLAESRLLSESGYASVHYDSEDGRGIDVAMLYRKDKFKVLSSKAVKVVLPDGERRTRDILHVSGILDGRYPVEILVNHWPSRFGGVRKTHAKREAAARTLSSVCDSLTSAGLHVIAMGDFNDGPDSGPVRMLSGYLSVPDVKVCCGNPDDGFLISLPEGCRCGPGFGSVRKHAGGSVKFGSSWELIDLMLFSESLEDCHDPAIYGDAFFVYANDALLEKDSGYGGHKVFRTYNGPRYNGGFSDHLPIFCILVGS